MPKTLATATVERLLHHAHVLLTDSTESYRLTQATSGKGVTPLPLNAPRALDCARPTAFAPSRPRAPNDHGENHGRQRGENMAATGEIRWPPLGRTRWPLTGEVSLVRLVELAGSSCATRAKTQKLGPDRVQANLDRTAKPAALAAQSQPLKTQRVRARQHRGIGGAQDGSNPGRRRGCGHPHDRTWRP